MASEIEVHCPNCGRFLAKTTAPTFYAEALKCQGCKRTLTLKICTPLSSEQDIRR